MTSAIAQAQGSPPAAQSVAAAPAKSRGAAACAQYYPSSAKKPPPPPSPSPTPRAGRDGGPPATGAVGTRTAAAQAAAGGRAASDAAGAQGTSGGWAGGWTQWAQKAGGAPRWDLVRDFGAEDVDDDFDGGTEAGGGTHGESSEGGGGGGFTPYIRRTPPPSTAKPGPSAFDPKTQSQIRDQRKAAEKLRQHAAFLGNALPLTYDFLFGEAAKQALDEGDAPELQDLDALNTSLLESVATDLTQQLTAYYLIAGSAHRLRAPCGDLSERAAEVFNSFADFDAYVRDELERGQMVPRLNCWEIIARAIPIGQIAANVILQLRPADARDLDEALFAAIDVLGVKSPRGDLCLTNLRPLATATRAVTESGQPCDWGKASQKLWDRLVQAKSVSYTHYDKDSEEFLEWDKFLAVSEFALSSSNEEQSSKTFLESIGTLNRFHIALGRDASKLRPKVHQVAADPYRSGDSGSDSDGGGGAPPVAVPVAKTTDQAAVLAVRATGQASGGKGRGKGAKGSGSTYEACWTSSCAATVQPHWNTCLTCNTVRPGT